MTFFKRWDDRQRQSAVKAAGILTAAFTVFAFIACFSYLFHWKEDMSILDPSVLSERGAEVGNAAGKLGYRFGRLMVCDYLGLGSLALLVLLIAVSTRLLTGKWRQPLLKTAALTVTGAVIASFALAFIGMYTGSELAFGGGLGGRFGAGVVALSCDQFKPLLTGVFIAALIALWLLLSSGTFISKMSGLFHRKPKKTYEEIKTEAEAESGQGPQGVGGTVKEGTAGQAADVEEPIDPGVDTGGLEMEGEIPMDVEPLTDVEIIGDSMEVITGNELSTVVKEPLPRIDNRLDPPDGLPKYELPSLKLLADYAGDRHEVSKEELVRNNNKIRAALANYKIQVVDVKALIGSTVTLYKVYPDKGVKITDIKRLQEDIAMCLNARGVRVVALSDSVGIEVANEHSSTVPLRALLNDESFRTSKAELPVAIGYTITQKVKVFDLADAPHLLVAGATKQGKSVGLNVIVSSLLFSKHPSELKFVFIDPKMVEFSSYGKLIKHYLAVLPEAQSEEDEMNSAIVKKPKDAERVLRSLCIEMDERYELLSKAGVNKISLYNDKYRDRHLLPTEGHKFLPYLVTVVDEYADLTMTIGGSPEARAASRSITNSIIRLAQKGRAAGIHVILATQRPSVDVISGLIKTNFPMRIAFRVASRVDSMTILDSPGAEKLIGRGDMLFSAGIETERVQCGYVGMDEIDSLTEFIGRQRGPLKSYNIPYYLPIPPENGAEGGSGTDMNDLDERFEEAAKLVVLTQKASTSYLQTKLGIGYAKGARVMSQLEAAGIVGPQDGAKPRQILISDLDSLQPILDSFVK